MNNKVTFINFIILILSFSFLNADEFTGKNFTSSYTSIEEKDCLTLDSDDLGSIQECEPFSDIKVKVVEGDIRQSITLTRNEKEYVLNFQSTVSPAFSTLGSKIEWRHEMGNSENLKGMIVRLDVNEDPENIDKVTSFLVVSKITLNEICVIGKILPQKNQNKSAREMLENASEAPCLKDIDKG